jgi:hypothetical protein
MDEFRNGGAYVGTSPWAYGGIYRPETQHVNEFGMVWAGDPPHESPGQFLNMNGIDSRLTVSRLVRSVRQRHSHGNRSRSAEDHRGVDPTEWEQWNARLTCCMKNAWLSG